MEWTAVRDGFAFEHAWPVLARAVGRPERDHARVRALYLGETAEACLFTLGLPAAPAGVIGMRLGPVGEILHMAVSADRARQGIGRALLQAAFTRYPDVPVWTAETDDEAVEFYRRVGFSVKELPPRYPGVTRYRCVLRPAA